MINSQEWLDRAKQLYNLQQQRKELEKAEKQLAFELRQITNDESLTYGGISYYYEIRTGSVDYASIPQLKGVDLERYRKEPVKVWKLAVERIV